MFAIQKQPEEDEDDVRGNTQTGDIPENDHDPKRRAVRSTMKMLQGPYPAFEKYHPLDDTIHLYNEIWYESSSSDN